MRNYKQVIPPDARQLAIIPHDRKPGLIAWRLYLPTCWLRH